MALSEDATGVLSIPLSPAPTQHPNTPSKISTILLQGRISQGTPQPGPPGSGATLALAGRAEGGAQLFYPELLYLGKLLLLPRGDGEVQDVVEAVGGCVEASCPPEVRQVLISHQKLGWQCGVHSYLVPGGSPKGRVQGAPALNRPARSIWTLANCTKGNTDAKLSGSKRAPKEHLDRQICCKEARSTPGQTSSPGSFRFLHHSPCKQIRGNHKATCPKQTADLINPQLLPLNLWELEDLLPDGEETLVLVLQANLHHLHHLHTQLLLASAMQELQQKQGGGGDGHHGEGGDTHVVGCCWGKPETEAPHSLLCRGINVKNNTGDRADVLGICLGQFFPPLHPHLRPDQVKNHSKSPRDPR